MLRLQGKPQVVRKCTEAWYEYEEPSFDYLLKEENELSAVSSRSLIGPLVNWAVC